LISVFSYWGTLERHAAAKTLASMPKLVINRITNLLKFSNDPYTREGAALTLGYMKEEAMFSVSALLTALNFERPVAAERPPLYNGYWLQSLF